MSKDYFPRTDTAKKLVNDLLSPSGSAGIFLSAPRRTGKSRFILEDVIPLLESSCEVVYVDLWSNKKADPERVMIDAFNKALEDRKGLFAKRADKINKAGIPGVLSADIKSDEEYSLNQLIIELSKKVRRPIVFIIDEAQHSQKTKNGEDAMFALKSARDMLNSRDNYGFRLLATGSSRSRLSVMVNSKDQAFLNAELRELPFLGKDYIAWCASKHDIPNQLDALEESFSIVKYSPEFFERVLKDFVDPKNEKNVIELAKDNILMNQQAFIKQIASLMPHQLSVLYMMCKDSNIAPYSESSITKYKTIMASISNDEFSFTSSAIQTTINSLVEGEFLWRSNRGAYFIDELQNAELVLDYVDGIINQKTELTTIPDRVTKNLDGDFSNLDELNVDQLLSVAMVALNESSDREYLSKINFNLLIKINDFDPHANDPVHKKICDFSNALEGKIKKLKPKGWYD